MSKQVSHKTQLIFNQKRSKLSQSVRQTVFNLKTEIYSKRLRKVSWIREVGIFVRDFVRDLLLQIKVFLGLYKWYSLVPQSLALKIKNLAEDNEAEVLTGPYLVPASLQKNIHFVPYKQRIQCVSLATLNDCFVVGGSNFIFNEEMAYHHDLYDFSQDFLSEELHRRFFIDGMGKRCLAPRFKRSEERSFERGAVFLDSCSFNYAHWLSEVYPRLVLFVSQPEYKDVPLILDHGLHQNIMESICLLVGEERPLIFLGSGMPIHIKKLYVVSPVGYIPFQVRPKSTMQHHGIFSHPALQIVRDQVLANQGFSSSPSLRKIYLKRKSLYRNILNIEKFESQLKHLGFDFVEPEKMSFLQQVKMFNEADEIIAGTGAALANIIFCKPACKVFVLMAIHEEMPYNYWQSMVGFLKLKITHILCQRQDSEMHSDYFVDTDLIRSLLSQLKHDSLLVKDQGNF